MRSVIVSTCLVVLACIASPPTTDGEDHVFRVEELATENARLKAEIQQLRVRLRAIQYPDASTVSKDIAALRFTALFRNSDGAGALGQFTVNGPIASTLRPASPQVTKIAVDSKGKAMFGRGHHDVYLLKNARETQLLKQNPELPEISWLSAIAYDTKRNRLLASTFGGRGYLYAFDIAKREWSIVCKPGLEVSALVFVESEDVLYGVNLAAGPNEAITTLLTFNANGARTSKTKLSQQIPTNGEFGHTQLAWNDGWLFLIQWNPNGRLGEPAGSAPRVPHSA